MKVIDYSLNICNKTLMYKYWGDSISNTFIIKYQVFVLNNLYGQSDRIEKAICVYKILWILQVWINSWKREEMLSRIKNSSEKRTSEHLYSWDKMFLQFIRGSWNVPFFLFSPGEGDVLLRAVSVLPEINKTTSVSRLNIQLSSDSGV